MSVKEFRPVCENDLRVLFLDELKITAKEFDEFFQIVEEKTQLIIKMRKFLGDERWRQILDLVVMWNGEYQKAPAKQFVIPIGPALKQPSTSPDVRSAPIQGAPQPKPTPAPVSVVAPGYYPNFPIERLLSPQHCFRVNIAEGIEELMAEINAAGRIIEPLICKPSVTSPGNIYLGPGERRLLAAKQLGMKTVPVVVDDFSDVEFDKIRLLENVARKDLTDYEVAQALDYMLRTYPLLYPTQEALGNDLQKNQEWISHHLAMLRLEKDNIMPRAIMEKMTEGQARAILSAPQEKQKEIAKQIEEEGRIPPMREISSTSEIERRTADTGVPEPLPESGTPEASAPKPEPLDVADFSCPECHQDFRIEHVTNKLHRFVPIKKEA